MLKWYYWLLLVVQVMGEGNKRVVTLSHRAQVRRFTSDLLRVLKSQTNRQLLVTELPGLFERVFNRPFDPVDYGLCFLEDLLDELSPNIVNLNGEGCELTIALPKREQTPEEIERTKQFAGQVKKEGLDKNNSEPISKTLPIHSNLSNQGSP